MSAIDMSEYAQRGKTTKHYRTIILPLVCLLLIPAVGLIKAAHNTWSIWLVAGGIVASGVAFLAYWSDKKKARTGQWRTPESTLHLLALAGGWPGAFVAQKMFRHKTKKQSFRIVFWGIVIIHLVGWLDYVLADGRGLLHVVQMIVAAAQ